VTRTIVSLLAAAVAGLVIGLAGAFVQAHRFVWILENRYLVVPWGAVIVLVVLLVSIRGAAKAAHSRSAGWFVLVGWLVMTFVLATESTSGDLAVSGGLRQWGYLLGGAILGSALATLPPRSFASLSNRSDHDGSGPQKESKVGRVGDAAGLD
jgi:hypothetical protein